MKTLSLVMLLAALGVGACSGAGAGARSADAGGAGADVRARDAHVTGDATDARRDSMKHEAGPMVDASEAGRDVGVRDEGIGDVGPTVDASDAGRDVVALDASHPPDGSDAGPDGGHSVDAGLCVLGATECVNLTTLGSCAIGDGGARVWVESACPAGSACIGTSCVTSCTDQCDLGATETTDAGTLTCSLFDLSSGTTIDAGTGMVDRARLYNAYLRQKGLPAGQVTYLEYTSPALSTISTYADTGDAAIFTGTYLASEAWRYKTTGSPDALASTTALVQTLHMLFNVAPNSPGYLARFAVPQNSPPILTNLFSTTDSSAHFDGEFEGAAYDWLGHISRDQYQGVVLGYSVAYDVLTDESVRDLIRQDMVSFVTQLMMTRSVCPTIDGIPCVTPISVQYTVITPSEPLSIDITTSPLNVTATGILEFWPTVLNLYPQSTVAIQLASAFEVALQVTANQPPWSSQYQTIDAFFEANVDSWLKTAQLWLYYANCGNSYFGNNIAFEPMFDLARLDQDATRQSTIRGILGTNMWADGVINDKNVWFAYIFAADDPTDSRAPAAVTMGNTQLAQFGAPPRVHIAVNNSFPANPNCTNEALDAIDVGQRIIDDFAWQRGPWTETDPGNPSEVFPGVDYLAAYWLGRAEGFLQDDTPTECTLWLP